MRYEIQVLEPSNLMQISSNAISLTSFSRWKLEITNEGRGEAAEFARREEKLTWPKGYVRFITPLIPDTSGINTEHVRYMRAGSNCSKNVLSLLIPFSVIAQSKKVYNIYPNWVSLLFLSNAKSITSLFQIFGIYRF